MEQEKYIISRKNPNKVYRVHTDLNKAINEAKRLTGAMQSQHYVYKIVHKEKPHQQEGVCTAANT